MLSTVGRAPPARLLWLSLAGLAALLVGLALTWAGRGPLLIDEVLYTQMTHGLVAGDGLTLWNGYESTPSPELLTTFTRVSGETLTSQYPYGAPLLAAPGYAVLGVRGLMLLNVLAFVGAVACCYSLGVRLLADRWAAFAGAALLATATYFLDYALVIWPHALAVLCVLGSSVLAVRGWSEPAGGRAALGAALLAGLVTGFGLMVRLDVVFVGPALAAPFFLAAPTRWRELLALAVGLVPGIAGLAVTNALRWGTPMPFSYGPDAIDLARYLPFGVAVVGTLALTWAVSRPRARRWLHERHRPLLLAAAGVMLAAVAVGPVRAAAASLVTNAWTIVGDMRFLPADRVGPALVRTAGDGVVYADGLKKALLQSVAFVPLVLLAFADATRDGTRRRAILWATVVPLAVVGFYGSLAWHGGLALNLRYLLPALPFLCLLSALALRRLLEAARPTAGFVSLVAGVLGGIAAYWGLRPPPSPSPARELFVLDVPLMVATMLTLLVVAVLYRSRRSTALATLAVAGIAIAWSGSAAVEDAQWSNRLRARNADASARVGAAITDDALLFVSYPDPFYGVRQHRSRVRIAIPGRDRFRDASPLARWHLDAGLRVYAVLSPSEWQALGLREREFAQRHATSPLTPTPLLSVGPYLLAELTRPASEPASP